MRSHPSCWNKTLAQLGFRRKRRKPSKAQDIHKRRSLFEMLEQRQMLSGDPLVDLSSDEIIVAAASTEQPIQLIANKPVFVLIQPEIPEEELLSLPEHEHDEVEPVFVVETVETKDGPKAIISLNPNNAVGPPSALQRLTLELHQNDQVVQSYDILIDIAEEDFREEFLADRIDKIEAQSEARSLGEVKQPINRPATAEEIAQATEYWNTFIGPKTLAEEQSMSLLFDATPQVQVGKAEVSTEDLVSIAKGRGRNDQLFRNTRDNKEFYSEVEKQTEKLKQDRQAATTDAERESVAEQERSLRKLALVLAKDLREDLKSTDSELAQSAQKVRDELVAISDPEELLFVGLGVDNEVQRKTNSQGDEKALSFIETGRYVFNESLEIDLSEHPAMVQVTKSSNLRTARATSVSGSPAVEDGTIDEANPSTNGGAATVLHVDGTSGSQQESLIRFDLNEIGNFSDPTTIASAALQLTESAAGTGDAEVYVWNGLLGGPAGGVTDWDETNASWYHIDTSLDLESQLSEFTQLNNWTAGTTTEIDVTDQIQRALLYGDANGDGVFGAAGMDGDIEAFHLAVTNWDAYVAEYGPRTNSASDLLNRTDGGLGDGTINTDDIVDFFRRHGFSQGDYNLDGTVQDNEDQGLDGQDWATWQANYGLTNARFTQGDGNFDGVVNDDDYDIWFDRKNEDNVVVEEPEIIIWVRPEDSTTDIEFASQEHATLDGPTLVVTEQPDLALNKFSVDGSNLVVDYAVLGDTFTDVKVQLYTVGSPDTLLHETAVQSGSLGSHEVLIATSVLSSIVEGDSIYAKVVGTPSSGAQANLLNDQLEFEFSTASTQTVNSLDDAGTDTLLHGRHTLRELLTANESLGWFDTLSFDESLFGAEQAKITLGDHTGDGVADRIVIDQDILVAGPGPQSLVIDARDQTQGILIDTAAVVTLSGLGVTQGYAIGHGAGIYNKGDLTLERISITDSNAQSHGGGIYNLQGATLDIRQSTIDNNSGYHGGGISGFFDVGQSLSIDQSTISNNTSSNHSGGLSIVGTAGATPVEVLIVNSTFSGNESGTSAGAIRAQTNTELTIIHSTIVDNSAVSSAGGIYSHTGATTTLHNSILADNTITANAPWASDASGPIGGTTAEPSTGNVIGIGQAGHQMDGNLNQVGTSASPLDPMLHPLGDYGGPTWTHALMLTSPSRTAGSQILTFAANADGGQNGLSHSENRVAGASGDQIAAGSSSTFVGDIIVTRANDEFGDDGIGTNYDDPTTLSLREALELAKRPDDRRVTFDKDVFSTAQRIELGTAGGYDVDLVRGSQFDERLDIVGPGADLLTIDANDAPFAFRFAQLGSENLLSGVSITGATQHAVAFLGDLTLNQVEIAGNDGHGIQSLGVFPTTPPNVLNISDSTIAENKHTGISLPLADANLSNVTISGNTDDGRAGGIDISGGDANLINVTITGNRADLDNDGNGNDAGAGGIYAGFGSDVTLHNTLVAANYVGGGSTHADLGASGGVFNSSSSYNFIGDEATSETINHDNLNNIVGDDGTGTGNPLLSDLGNYGGPTETHVLLTGSPAIDAGLESLAVYEPPNGPQLPLTTDQRGFERVFDSGDAGPTGGLVDIGATEYDTYIGFGDLNGDGRTDRIGFDLRSNRINAVLDYGSHFASEYWEDLANTGDWTEFHTGDFNGDGRDDLMAFDDNVDQWTIAVSDSTQFSVSDVKTRSGEIITTNWGQIHVGDFDGDGSHELIGRTDVSSNWQFLDYDERLGATFQSDFGSTLASGFSAWYVGDVNRDGRDDLIAKRNSGGWNVALSELNGNSFRLGGSSQWTNWFENYLVDDVPDVDAPYQKVIDEFSWVYNNVELELYRGFLKGPQGAYQTKAANPFDQAALLVDRLEEAGFDADIEIGRIRAPYEAVRDWIGAPPVILAGIPRAGKPTDQEITAVESILQEAFDPTATHVPEIGTNGHFEFDHAWVKALIPTDSGLVKKDLDPSWKFKDRQPGIYPTWSHAFRGDGRGEDNLDIYSDDGIALTETGHFLTSNIEASYSQFVPKYFGNTLDQRSPVEDFTNQLREELAAYTTHYSAEAEASSLVPDLFPATSSIADIPYDGPIITRSFSHIPVGLGGGVSDIDTHITLPNIATLDTNSDAAVDWSHRTNIEISGAVSMGTVIDREIIAARESLKSSTITFDGLRPHLNLMVLDGESGGIDIEGDFDLQSGENISVVVTAFRPGQDSMSTDLLATDPTEFSQDQVVAIGLNAHQVSTGRIGDIQGDLLKQVDDVSLGETDTGHKDHLDNILGYTIQKYWHDFNNSRRSFSELSNLAQIAHHIEVAFISSDNAFSTAESAPFGIIPQDVSLDVQFVGTDTHQWHTGLRSKQASWATGLEGSHTEHSVVEEVTGEVAVSALKGLQRAYLGSLGIDENGTSSSTYTGSSGNNSTGVVPLHDQVYIYTLWDNGEIARDFLFFNGDTFKTVRDSSSNAHRSYINNSTLVDVLKGDPIHGGSIHDDDHLLRHDVNPNDGGALPVAEAIAEIFGRPDVGIGTTVLVPKFRTALKDPDGTTTWTGSVFAANIVTDSGSSSSFEFVVIPDDGPVANGGVATGSSVDASNVPTSGNDSFHPVVGNLVNAANGNLSVPATDIQFPNLGFPLNFSRQYNSQAEIVVDAEEETPAVKQLLDVGLGVGWTHSFGDRLIIQKPNPGFFPDVIWQTASGELHRFEYNTDDGVYESPTHLFGKLLKPDTNEILKYQDRNGTEYHFERSNLHINGTATGNIFARLKSKVDLNGDGFDVTYPNSTSLNVSTVSDVHTSLRQLVFTYSPTGQQIETVQKWDIDPANSANSIKIGTWDYGYGNVDYRRGAVTELQKVLTSVTSPSDAHTSFATASPITVAYDYYGAGVNPGPEASWGRLSHIRDPREVEIAGTGSIQAFDYFHNGRVASVTDAENGRRSFTYNLARNETQVVDENGNLESFLYQSNGLLRRHILEDRTSRELLWGVRGDSPTQLADLEDINEFSSIVDGTDYLLQLHTDTSGALTYNEYYVDPNEFRFGELRKTTSAQRVNRSETYRNPGLFGMQFILEAGIETQYDYVAPKSHLVLPSTVTVDNPDGDDLVTEFSYHPTTGQLLRTKDPEGNITTRGYSGGTGHSAGLLFSITAPNGRSDENKSRLFKRLQTSAAQNYFQVSSGTLTVRLTDSAGSGSTAPLVADAVRITPIDPLTGRLDDSTSIQILDDESPGFSVPTGTITTADHSYTANGIYGDTVSLIDGNGSHEAVWEFSGLPDGYYRVAVSLTENTANSATARYEIFDGTTAGVNVSGPIALDQRDVVASYGSHQQVFTYDAAGNIETIRQEGIPLQTNQFDSNGNVISSIDGTGRETVSTYDILGRLRSTHQVDMDGNLPPNVRTFEYFANGLPKANIDPLGNTASFTYDRNGRLTATEFADGSKTSTTYDGAGNVVAQTDETGNTTRYAYDQRDRVVDTFLPDGAVERVRYGGDGRIAKTIDPQYTPQGSLGTLADLQGNATTFSYDVAGRLLATVNAAGHVAQNDYDSLGRLELATDFRGNQTHYTYDQLGRVMVVRGFGAETTSALATAQPTSLVTTDYDPSGNLAAATVYDVVTDGRPDIALNEDPADVFSSPTYDSFKQVTVKQIDSRNRPTKTVNADGTETSTVYDAVGRVRFEINELGVPTELRYDGFGRLKETLQADVGVSAPSITANSPVTTLHYDAADNIITVVDANGHATSNAYDARNRLIATTNAENETSRSVYDEAGRMVASINALGAASYSQYDKRGREVLARSANPDLHELRSTASESRFTYDAIGNVVMSTNASGVTTRYTYNELNQLTEEFVPSTLIVDDTDYLSPTWNFTGDTNDRNYESKQINSFGDDYSDIAASDYDPEVTWKFDDVQPGKYRVAVTWQADPSLELNANFTVEVGSTVHPNISGVNQQEAPDDFVQNFGGTWLAWKELMAEITVSDGDSVAITLSGSDGGTPIRADAVMLERIDAKRSFTYDENGNLKSETDTRGFKTQYGYDVLNRLDKTTLPDPNNASNEDPTAQIIEQAYDGYGNVVEVIESRGGTSHERSTKFEYDSRNRLVEETFDFGGADEVKNTYQYDSAGNLFIETRALNTNQVSITRNEYDHLNRLDRTHEYTDAVGEGNSLTNFRYDNVGNITRRLDTVRDVNDGPDPNVLRRPETLFTYDKANRLIQEDVNEFHVNGKNFATTFYRYDDAGNLTTETDPTLRVTTYEYDRLNQLISTTLPAPETGVTPKTTFEYDVAGNVVTQSNAVVPVPETTRYIYDAFGSQLFAILPDSTETQYTYDSANNLLTISDANHNTTRYEYDGFNRVTQDTNELGYSRFYAYNDQGNLEKAIDRNGRRRDFTYDRLDRVVREEWWNTTADDTTIALPANRHKLVHYLEWQYDGLGRVIAAADVPIETSTPVFMPSSNGTVEESSSSYWERYTFDNLGRITEQTNFNNDGTGQLSGQSWTDLRSNPLVKQSYDYDEIDPAFNTEGREEWYQTVYTQEIGTDNSGTSFNQVAERTYTFDLLGRVTQIDEPLAALGFQIHDKTINFEYERNGLLRSVNRLANRGNSTTSQANSGDFVLDTTYTYDGTGRFDQISHARFDIQPGTLATFGYQYDPASRIDQILSTFSYSSVNFSRTQDLQFDASGTGQLVGEATSFQVGSAINVNNTYGYDDNGNRIQLNSANVNVNVGSNNQTSSDTTYNYFYDREGNLIRRVNKSTNATTEYMWDYRNRLAEVREFESEAIDFQLAKDDSELVTYNGEAGTGEAILNDGTTLRLENQSISRAIDLESYFDTPGGYQVTSNTVLEFDYTSDQQGTWGGVVFDTDTNFINAQPWFFQVYGTNAENVYLNHVDGFEEYIQGDGTKHYRINLGAFYDSTKHIPYKYLAFRNAASGQVIGTSEFSNVRLYEESSAGSGIQSQTQYRYNADDLVVRKEATEVPDGAITVKFEGSNLLNYSPSSTAGSYDTISADGSSITISGNNEVAIDLSKLNNGNLYQVTPDTVVKFDFSSSGQSQVNGFLFDNQLANWSFGGKQVNVYGFQNVPDFLQGIPQYSGSGTQTFTIRLGDYVNSSGNNNSFGPTRYLVLNNRNAQVSGGDSTFSNIRIYQEGTIDPLARDDSEVEHYVYDGSQLVMTLNDEGKLKDRYTYSPGIDNLLVDEVFDAAGNESQTLWALTDHAGTVHDLIDDDNHFLVEHRDYDAFGNLKRVVDSGGNSVELENLATDFAFAGRNWDNDVGLYYNRARWYDPALGKFISRDPIGFDGGDSNLYRYANNDLTNYRDPSGNFFIPILAAVGKAFAVAAAGVGLAYVDSEINDTPFSPTLNFTFGTDGESFTTTGGASVGDSFIDSTALGGDFFFEPGFSNSGFDPFADPLGSEEFSDLALSFDLYSPAIGFGADSRTLLGGLVAPLDLFTQGTANNDIQFELFADDLQYLYEPTVAEVLREQINDRAYDQAIMEQRILDRQEQEFAQGLSYLGLAGYYAADIGTDLNPIVAGAKSLYQNGSVIIDPTSSFSEKAFATGNIGFDFLGGKLIKKGAGLAYAGGARLKKFLGYGDEAAEAAEAALRNAPVTNRAAQAATQLHIDRAATIRTQLGIGKTRNIAFAEGQVGGRSIGEIVGVSGKNTPGVKIPSNRTFKTGVDGFDRAFDAEVAVFENLARKLRPGDKGTIRLFSERPFCESCSGVIQQFEQKFPGIKLVPSTGP